MKSTFCFQFSKIFQDTHQNGVIVYLDIEGAGNAAESGSNFGQISRIDSFGLNSKTFQYQPVILDVTGVFNLMEKLADIKQAFEEKLKKEFFVCVILDSLSATRSSKTDAVEDVNQIIGYKARELTFKLEKFSPMIAFKRFTFIVVDQVRANLKNMMDPYAAKERTVGMFNDMRAATSINSLNHLVGQWLYFSKKKTISAADGLDIDGWEVYITTEKNKNAPSQYTITCVFDKINGFDKFWSEYRFLSEMTPSENKIYKKSEASLKYPLAVISSGAYTHLKVVDPENHKNVLYKSDSMYKKNMKKLYNSDEEFRQWFDYVVEISSQQRIVNGLFKCQNIDTEDEAVECKSENEYSDLLPEQDNDPTGYDEQENEESESLI